MTTAVLEGILAYALDGRLEGPDGWELSHLTSAFLADGALYHWRVVLDLTDVSFVSDDAIGFFGLWHLRCANRGGHLVLAHLQPGPAESIHLANMDRVLSIVPTLAEACHLAKYSNPFTAN